jgi:UPF0755 protein
MKKKVFYLISVFSVLMVLLASQAYRVVFGINVLPKKGNSAIYIPTGSTYRQVLDSIKMNLNIRDPKILDWVAGKKDYPSKIRPGRYVINKGLSYNGLINILRSGRQSPVRLTFNNIRTINQLASRAGSKLEADSLDIMTFFNNESNFKSDGFDKYTIIALFVPDTYELFWNTDAAGFYKRMLKEYRQFWNEKRLALSQEQGLTPVEVATLASIIDDEVAKKDEKPRIAGVYLNRLKRGMPLQACPTIKFAMNDFTITRVLFKYLEVESPYNTYKHTGLPPGPVGCATVEGIDAVLNADKNDYLFFAAKADFSGYHNFSRTLAEHNHYAALYQKELDRRRIFK